jgi:hypothetical protein
MENLITLCYRCHAQADARARKQERREIPTGAAGQQLVREIIARYDLDDPEQRHAAEAELRRKFGGPWPAPEGSPVLNSRIW